MTLHKPRISSTLQLNRAANPPAFRLFRYGELKLARAYLRRVFSRLHDSSTICIDMIIGVCQSMNVAKRKKEFSLDLRGLRTRVAERVTEHVNAARQHAYPITIYPSQVSRVLSGERGSRWAELIRETARQVAIEMGGVK